MLFDCGSTAIDEEEEDEAGGTSRGRGGERAAKRVGEEKSSRKAKKKKRQDDMLQISIKHPANATRDEIARVRTLLPSILQSLPQDQRKLAKQLGGDIKQHQVGIAGG